MHINIALTKFSKKLTAAILAAGLFLSISLSLFLSSPTTGALSGSQFKPGRIIDDNVFYNGSSMSVNEIQQFLDSKVPECDTNGTKMYTSTQTRAQWAAAHNRPTPPYTCLKDYKQNVTEIINSGSDLCQGSITSGNKTAAQIIYDVAKACGVSPKVLLVLLQKEQSLVTDDWPWPVQYTKATGYGCPDSDLPSNVDANDNGCYDEYEGFANQIYNAAKGYRRYRANPDNYNYKAGRNNTILWHPNTGCGTSNVYIENQATAGLYIYTPYRPNKAALDNLYGTGNGCSSYGNRNFWRMFNDWFGPTIGRSFNFERLSGPAPSLLPNNSTNLGSNTATVVRGKNIHTFYYDSTNKSLRHTRWNGERWFDEVLDGQGSAILGSTTNDVGNGLTATEYKDGLQLYYRDTTLGALRHAWWSDAAGKWRFETFDGTSGSVGKLNANLGQDPVVITYKEGLQLFYHDSTNGNLRHAWWSDAAGKWRFETFDGTSGSVGKLNANLGRDPELMEYNGGLQLFYHDSTNGNLRHAWWSDAAGKWKFETFDGTSDSVGKLNANLGRYSGVGTYDGGVQLFYYDATNENLRHAWWSENKQKWGFETFDGTESSIGGNAVNLGRLPVIKNFDNRLYVFYYNHTDKAWEGAMYDRGWYTFTLDGKTSSLSRSDGNVGGQLSIGLYENNSLQLFYRDGSGGLKHSWAR